MNSPSFNPHPPEGKPWGVVLTSRPSSAWTPPWGAPPTGPAGVQGLPGGPLPFGPRPRAGGPPPSGPPPGAQGKPPSGSPPGAWGPPPSGPPPGVWGQPPSGPFHASAPHTAIHSNMPLYPQATTMQPAFAGPILMQPQYMALAHLPPPSMGPPYMQQAAHTHNMQQQAAAMHIYRQQQQQQQQQLFMMHQQHSAVHGMGEQPYRVDPLGQLPRVPGGCRRL